MDWVLFGFFAIPIAIGLWFLWRVITGQHPKQDQRSDGSTPQ
jgi:uncharacterized membrane protein